MNVDEITAYNQQLLPDDQEICTLLREVIDRDLPKATSKIWHGAPVWFLDGNPTAGYSKLKNSVRLMFWSGADFDEPGLTPGSGKFKDAHIDYTDPQEINMDDVSRWLNKSESIQWNYKDIVKHRGKLERLK